MNIKPIFFTIAASAFSIPSFAEWEIIAWSNEVSSYIDTSTLRSKGSIRRIWNMDNISGEQQTIKGQKYSSVATLIEYDCKEDKYRSLQSTFYSGGLGTGSPVHTAQSSTEARWTYHAPGSIGARVAQAVCSLNVKRE